MSPTPVTPALKAKTPVVSTKRRRVVDDDDEENMEGTPGGGSSANAIRSLANVVRAEVKEAFGEDRTWHGSRFLAPITTLEGRRVLQGFIHLWLVFGTAFDQALQFGPKNVYNVRQHQLVADFVVEQWGVRPEQLQKFPSGGKTIRYLLTFDEGELRRLTRKLPRGWVKLARGLGCRLICPAEYHASPFPATILHAPVGISELAMRRSLERETFIRKVTDFERVAMENNVKTDRIDVMVETMEAVDAPVSKNMESFCYEFYADGFRLELTRRHLCVTCGDEDHVSTNCQVRRKLVSSDVKSWSFVVPDERDSSLGSKEGTILPAEEIDQIAGEISKGVAALEAGKVTGAGGGAAPQKERKKRNSRKRKTEEAGPQATKKART